MNHACAKFLSIKPKWQVDWDVYDHERAVSQKALSSATTRLGFKSLLAALLTLAIRPLWPQS